MLSDIMNMPLHGVLVRPSGTRLDVYITKDSESIDYSWVFSSGRFVFREDLLAVLEIITASFLTL